MRSLLIIVWIVSGCATLKSHHTQNVKSFARSCKTLSVVPGQLFQNISDYRHDLRMIESSTLFTPEKVIVRMNKIVESKEKFDQNAAKINGAATLIESYAECLLALTDDSYATDWKKQSDDLSMKLNSAVATYNRSFQTAIPPSIGKFIGGVVNKIGSIKLKQLQKQYLKTFVDTGAFIINDVCDFLSETTAETLQYELTSLDQQFENIMASFYDKVLEFEEKRSVNPFNYLKDYNPVYLDMKARLNGLHYMQQQMVASMKKIKSAHEKLQVSVDNQMTGEIITEIRELYAIANEITSSYKKFVK